MKTAIDILFIAITVFLVVMFFFGTRKIFGNKTGNLLTLLLIITLTAEAILATQNIFSNFNSLPPRVMFTAMPWFIISFIFLFHPRTSSLLKNIPQHALSGIQAYRIPVEIVLWGLVTQNIIPVQMSFEGLNFDIISGILGGIIGLLLYRGIKLSRWIIITWNLIGIGLLLNILIIAFLSAPTPLRYFMNDPANTFIATFPYIWLPGFVAPMALLIHFLSLRKKSMTVEKSL